MLFPMGYIPFLNVFIVVFFLFCLYSGYKQGFLLKAIGCIGFVAIGFISWFLAPYISNYVALFPKSLAPLQDTIVASLFYNQLNTMCIFALLFIALSVLIMFLKPLLKTVRHIPILAQINHFLGLLFGCIQALIIISIICVLCHTPLIANGDSVVENSFLKPISQVSDTLLFFANDYFSQLESVQKLLRPSDSLDRQDWEEVSSWLASQNVSQEDIERFIQSIRGK